MKMFVTFRMNEYSLAPRCDRSRVGSLRLLKALEETSTTARETLEPVMPYTLSRIYPRHVHAGIIKLSVSGEEEVGLPPRYFVFPFIVEASGHHHTVSIYIKIHSSHFSKNRMQFLTTQIFLRTVRTAKC